MRITAGERENEKSAICLVKYQKNSSGAAAFLPPEGAHSTSLAHAQPALLCQVSLPGALLGDEVDKRTVST